MKCSEETRERCNAPRVRYRDRPTWTLWTKRHVFLGHPLDVDVAAITREMRAENPSINYGYSQSKDDGYVGQMAGSEAHCLWI